MELTNEDKIKNFDWTIYNLEEYIKSILYELEHEIVDHNRMLFIYRKGELNAYKEILECLKLKR